MVSCSMRYSVSVTSLFLCLVWVGWMSGLRPGTAAQSRPSPSPPSSVAGPTMTSGTTVPCDEPVVRADDGEFAGGDGLADQLGFLEQLGDGVAQVLAADRSASTSAGSTVASPPTTRRTAGTIGSISR